MSISMSYRRGLLAAGSFAFLVAAAGPLAAQQQPRAVQCNTAMSAGRPGFSPIDKTKVEQSKQDTNLKPHPTPPIATAVDKLPIDKIKLPSGFKAEVWSSGHPGARTMVMGDKGTMFMGTRVDRARLCHHRQGRQARGQGHHPGPDAAERPRLQGWLALRLRDQQGVPLRQDRGQSRQAAGPGRADHKPTICPTPSTTIGNTSRSGRTARCTCRSARTATSARSIPASTARSAATTPTAPAWRSWRAASATRSASTGIR